MTIVLNFGAPGKKNPFFQFYMDYVILKFQFKKLSKHLCIILLFHYFGNTSISILLFIILVIFEINIKYAFCAIPQNFWTIQTVKQIHDMKGTNIKGEEMMMMTSILKSKQFKI